MQFPDDLRYTAEHVWLREQGSTARVGITAYAQDELGDVVSVTLPDAGSEVVAGQPLGEVESTESVSDVYAPVSGRLTGRNDALETAPELVNSDPYGEGWLVEIAPAAVEQAEGGSGGVLMTAAEYARRIER